MGTDHEGIKLKAGALRLAKEIGDRAGEANELSNLALMASGAARYEDAIALSDAALATAGTAQTPEICSLTQLNRANALFRNGRLDEALVAASVALASIEPPPTGRRLTNLVLAQVCVAEILIEVDRATEARAVLLAARGWAERWDELAIGGVARVEALLKAAAGDVSAGLREIAMLVERRGEHGSDFAQDGDLLDCLHAMYRIQRRAGDRAGALEALRRIGAVYMANAESTVATLVGLAEDVPIQLNAGKFGEIDRYLTLKSVEAGTATHSESRTWSYLVDAAANATSIEDGTLEHGPRVARLARYVAERLGEPPKVVEAIEVGALLHEVGKLGVSDVILRKTEPLEEKEAELYAAHAAAGAQLLERADIPHKRVAVNVARYHHAPFDGHGGSASTLLGEAIPREARIVAVCDAFDAFVMGRPRRPAVSVQEALRELLRQSGRDFDPRVVDALIATVRELEREHGDAMQYLADAAGEIDYFATQRLLRCAGRSG